MLCTFSTSQLQKVVRACGVLYISGPPLRCFVHFDFKMRFSLQRRTIFPHRNFKKWSEPAVFCTFWLQNVHLATAACNFSIATSKSGPPLGCFVHFDFKMCFSLQRRAIFHFGAQQPPPHPPLYRGYFSTQPTHKSLKNTAFRDFPTSSTARGGGGSFKNRKPIGENGCCESPMAEQKH